MLFLNKESIYENDLVKRSGFEWQDRKYSKSKCPLCTADISDDNVSSATRSKKRNAKDNLEKLGSDFSIPATLLNGGILSIAGCGFPGVKKNAKKNIIKSRNNNKTIETIKTLCNKRVIEPDAMLGPKRTFPCSGCPINMLPFTVRRNGENDVTMASPAKSCIFKHANDEKKRVSRSISVCSRDSGQKYKRRKMYKISEAKETELPKTKSSSYCKSPQQCSSQRSVRLKRHHSLLTVRKKRRHLSSSPAHVPPSSTPVETQVNLKQAENHQPITYGVNPRASNRPSKNVLNCTYENKSSQIESESPVGAQYSSIDLVPQKAEPMETEGSELIEDIARESSKPDCSVCDVHHTDMNPYSANETVKNVTLENNESTSDSRSEKDENIEDCNDSLLLKCFQDLTAEEQQTRLKNSFEQKVQELHLKNSFDRSVQELHLKNSVDPGVQEEKRSDSRDCSDRIIEHVKKQNNYIDDAIMKAKTHDFLHEFYQELGKEDFDGGMLDDDTEDEYKERSDDQLIIIDSSASDVHEDNPILSDDEKRAILEEMVGPRVNYFKFDSETDNDDASPCGKYLNKLPQVFRIKTNGDLKKFEIENIVRQYRYSYLVRIMNKCPKPDFRLRRCRRSDRTERFYIEPSIKKKRLIGRTEQNKYQPGANRRSNMLKRSAFGVKRMKRELGPATIWNGSSPLRRKMEAPKFCQTLDYNALFDLEYDNILRQIDNSKLAKGPPFDSKERLVDNLEPKKCQNINQGTKSRVDELWNAWEMDRIGNYLKTAFNKTANRGDGNKVNLPNSSVTKGKSCPFSPWPCPLGPICPFPPTNGTKKEDAATRKENTQSSLPNMSNYFPPPNAADIVTEMANLANSHLLDLPLFKYPSYAYGNDNKKANSINKLGNKVSIGTVTSCECVILPKSKVYKKKKGDRRRHGLSSMNAEGHLKTKKRKSESGDTTKSWKITKKHSKSEHHLSKKVVKGCHNHSNRKLKVENPFGTGSVLSPNEGLIRNNDPNSSHPYCRVKTCPTYKNFTNRETRSTVWKRVPISQDSLRTSRCERPTEYLSKIRRENEMYKGLIRTSKAPPEHFFGYQHGNCHTAESSTDPRYSLEYNAEDRQRNFSPEHYSRKHQLNEPSLFPAYYHGARSSDIKRINEMSRENGYVFQNGDTRDGTTAKAHLNIISKGYQPRNESSSNKVKSNCEFTSRTLPFNDFYRELSFYADPTFPKPSFAYNRSLCDRKRYPSCLPPSVASKIILKNENCLFRNRNPVVLPERTKACAGSKGPDQTWTKRASGKHVSNNLGYL